MCLKYDFQFLNFEGKLGVEYFDFKTSRMLKEKVWDHGLLLPGHEKSKPNERKIDVGHPSNYNNEVIF